MTRPQGPGGLDLSSMMKQLQQVQAEMDEAQEKLKDEVVEASAGGGVEDVVLATNPTAPARPAARSTRLVSGPS